MQDLLDRKSRFQSTRRNPHVSAWRQLGAAALGATITTIVAADAFCAAPASVEISPMVGKSTFLSPVAGDQQISVVLTLPLSDPAGAADFVQHVSQRGDPLFHQYLTPQEFAARFGANPDDYAALKEWATANGLTISQESIARTCLTVRGTVSQFQTLFNTQINNYRSPAGDQFYSASSKLTVPSAIASKISGIVGLTSSKHSAPLVTVGKTLGENPAEAATPENKTADSGTGLGGSYSPADLQRAYFIPTFGNLDKTAVVAVFEQGGFTESDVVKFLDRNKLPHRKVTPVSVNGSPTTVVTSNLRIELEAVLDIDMVIGTNPDVSEVRVYEDSVDPFPVALLDALNQVADDKVAEILSISYGADEAAQGDDAMNAEQTAIMELAGLGITVTASSGDKGAYGDGTLDDYNVSDPASQPYVTGVGGTTLLTGPHQAWAEETVWNSSTPPATAATGGGISWYWPIPTYQSTTVSPYYVTYNGGSSTSRNVPDVSAVGDPNTGVGVYSKVNGGWLIVGGTSVGAPIWGGYLSIINAGLKYAGLGPLGYFNPILYNIGYWVRPFVVKLAKGGITTDYYGNPGDFLYPIFYGNNGDTTIYPGYPGYSAGGTLFQPAYCNATGCGSLFGGGLAAQLLISGLGSGTAPGPLPPPKVTAGTTTAVVKWSAATAAAAYAVTVQTPGYVLNDVKTYITKATSMKLTDLVPHDSNYEVTVWAFNANGFTNAFTDFTTK
jgi:subtilase family serine protease